jgi:hypothetical protein
MSRLNQFDFIIDVDIRDLGWHSHLSAGSLLSKIRAAVMPMPKVGPIGGPEERMAFPWWVGSLAEMKPAETLALLEKAVQHVLAEQAKLLKRPDIAELSGPARLMGELASATMAVIRDGVHKVKATEELTVKAREIEHQIDQYSALKWTPIEISVSSIYERIEETFSFTHLEEKLGLQTAIGIRNHFQNVRLRLLEQLLNARALQNVADKGFESERIWLQFFQRQLGTRFQVLQGGHVFDYKGRQASRQIDILVVPSDANIIVPGDSDGGKVHVFADQVVAAIMVASTLDPAKLAGDWKALAEIVPLFDAAKEFPQLKNPVWPLCYIVARQSPPIKELREAWAKCFREAGSTFAPQFVVSLDSGYVFSGATAWPRPRSPSNYKTGDEAWGEENVYSGLGLAWVLTQIRGRLAFMENRDLRPAHRFAHLLDDASMKSATPPTFSYRFNTMLQRQEVAGVLKWGLDSMFAHNGMQVNSLRIDLPELKTIRQNHIFVDGTPENGVDGLNSHDYVRWFHFPWAWPAGRLVALEERIKPANGGAWPVRIAVFDTENGQEIRDHGIDHKSSYDQIKAAIAALSTTRS